MIAHLKLSMCTSVVSYTKDLSLGDWRPYFVWEIGVGDGGGVHLEMSNFVATFWEFISTML